ncbi:MAG: PQQ-binding-like beta-propeller repeat protein [Parvularculaceae bacterium]|nr:PQQ-binding-like beta-propeller repeat protein [Parvularculaceae bacterium]
MANRTRAAAFRVLLLAFAVLGAPACSSGPIGAVAGIFGGGDDDETEENAPKEEDRISILAVDEQIEADPRYAGVALELPPSYVNTSWPTPGGEADHTLHHLSTAGALETVWTRDIGKAEDRARLTSPPIVVDGVLYVIDAKATVTAYNVETGEVVWERELAPKIKEKFRVRDILSRTKAAQVGFGGGVSFENGRLFVTSGFGFALALDATNGEELWRYQADGPVRTPPTAYRGALYFVTNVNEVVALDQASGEEQWTFQSYEETARILSSASPAAAGDLVVAPFSSGEVVAFLAGSGRAVWNDTLARNTQLTALSALNDIAGSPVIDRGLVYAVSHAGRFVAIDIRTGRRVWEAPIASIQMPWVAGDFIYVVSVDAELVCLSRNDGAIVWVSQLKRYDKPKKRKGRVAWAGPVLGGDALILVSTDGEVVKVSPQDGSIIDTKKISDGSVISPIIADEKIFILSQKGKLYALR